MLVVLIALNGNRRKSRIAADVLGFAQMSMTRVEAILEQLDEVNLATGASDF